MKKLTTKTILFVLITFCFPSIFIVSCSSNSSKGKLIITLAPANSSNENFVDGTFWRFPEQAKIAAVDPSNPGKDKKILTGEFYSAASPDISYDGNFMLFAGQQKKGDPWRIWEMNLKNLKTRAISPAGGLCTDPVYLPAGRLAFSRQIEKDSLMSGFSLYTGNLDGSGISRITFSPAAFFASNLLADGRIITVGRSVYPDTGSQMIMVMRPDGTKSELLFLLAKGSTICRRTRETSDGMLVFIESADGTGKEGSLASVGYNRPLHTYTKLSTAITGSFKSVLPLSDGKYIVCYRKSESEKYSLFEFNPAKKEIGKNIYTDKELDVIDAVADVVHQRPKKLPSEVDMHVKTGLLMCQNINFLNPAEKNANGKKAAKIELLGIGKSLGVIDVEKDGSFYIKPIADSPFRIQTLDENGKVINRPCSWIYLRPNERRGCVGCHEDMEMTPENRIALAVKKKPVIFPVHIVKIKEKKVELE